jgi:uncharacterized protein (DUF608 family)
VFTGAFPFARLKFEDPKFPLQVSLVAYKPFIPLNPDDSGLPVAIFHFEIQNPTDEPVRLMLYANLENRAGHPETGQGVIEYFEMEGGRGLRMSSRKHPPDSPRFSTLALATPYREALAQTHWLRAYAFGPQGHFWRQASQGILEENREPAYLENDTDVGTIALPAVLAPGERVSLPVWIAWHAPNFEKYWGREKAVWKNYYATRFDDVLAVIQYLAQNHKRLEAETRLFADTLYASTLPEAVLDAVSSQMSILKTPTCILLEDGTFWGWEGCKENAGSCEGSCTHVWNYAQALPFLFPQLERSMRNADYRYNLSPDGHMSFRMPLPPGTPPETEFHAAADGQLGGVMKVYRDWLIGGGDDWLRQLWPSVKKALEYTWLYWDQDRDGVIEGLQHVTYDIELFGPNAMVGSWYLGALRAAEEMARAVGDEEASRCYRSIFESGRARMDASLFNGEYYVQDARMEALHASPYGPSKPIITGDPDEPVELRFTDNIKPGIPRFQIDHGCLSDQIIGQWFAQLVGLGHLFEPAHVRSALASIFAYNWKSDLSEFPNPARIFAINHEAGLVMATWPGGDRPGLPFYFADEVWCGTEYQVASHLLYEGFIDEGLAIVKGARDRHTGELRNPWNEIEAGYHYARSMASYSLLLALSDFYYSAPEKFLHFSPRVYKRDFACFFSVDSGWGILRQEIGESFQQIIVEVRYGHLELSRLQFSLAFDGKPFVQSGNLAVESAIEKSSPGEDGAVLVFAQPLTIVPGQVLMVKSGNRIP